MIMKTILEDLTIIIPVKLESTSRIKNLSYILTRLTRLYKTNIVVIEQGKESLYEKEILSRDYKSFNSIMHIFIESQKDFFYKTYLINEAIRRVKKTKLIAVYDSDIILNESSIINASNLLLIDKADFIYPYNGTFINVMNFDYSEDFSDIVIGQCSILHLDSPGGCFVVKRDIFLNSGMMNENFKSWGFEDDEIRLRIDKLGYRIKRLEGECYHIDHPRTKDSSSNNPYYPINYEMFERIRNMTKNQLREEIIGWQWKI